jgi:YaiO family outer membrane protein
MKYSTKFRISWGEDEAMKNWKAVLLSSLSVFASPLLHAQDDVAAQAGEPAQVEVGASLEMLNNGYADWRSNYIVGEKKLGEREAVYGSLLDTERFNLNDTQILAGVYYPLASRWTLLLEGNTSPTHNVLAKTSALSQIQYTLDDGWNVQLGARHTEYSSALTNTVLVTGERYWSNYRAAYTQSVSNLAGAGSVSSGRIQLSKYYDEHSSIGVGFSQGSEIENLGLTLGILITPVQYIGMNGRHWFSRDWAASYEVATTKQGSLYTRNTFQLGLRRQF